MDNSDYRLQKVSSYGTNTAAVARTAYQGTRLAGAFPLSAEERGALTNVLLRITEAITRCFETCETLKQDTAAAESQFRQLMSDDPARAADSMPGVGELMSRAEDFIVTSKRVIHFCSEIVTVFHHVEAGYNFKRLHSSLGAHLPPNDPLLGCVSHWEPWVDEVGRWRNAVEHPKDAVAGRLVVVNIGLESGRGGEFTAPTWGLLGEPQHAIVPAMEGMVESLIELQEDFVVITLEQRTKGLRIRIREIPLEERDPACPERFMAVIDPSPLQQT